MKRRGTCWCAGALHRAAEGTAERSKGRSSRSATTAPARDTPKKMRAGWFRTDQRDPSKCSDFAVREDRNERCSCRREHHRCTGRHPSATPSSSIRARLWIMNVRSRTLSMSRPRSHWPVASRSGARIRRHRRLRHSMPRGWRIRHHRRRRSRHPRRPREHDRRRRSRRASSNPLRRADRICAQVARCLHYLSCL